MSTAQVGNVVDMTPGKQKTRKLLYLLIHQYLLEYSATHAKIREPWDHTELMRTLSECGRTGRAGTGRGAAATLSTDAEALTGGGRAGRTLDA